MPLELVHNPQYELAIKRYCCKCLYNDSLEVKTSWLPGCGFAGLFTRRFFKQGEIVCVYIGRELTTKEAMHLTNKEYLMRLGPQRYIDAKLHTDILARYINDPINPAGWNVVFNKKPEHGCAEVVALRDITAGEEIFVSYGKWYWLSAYSLCSTDNSGRYDAPVRLGFKELSVLRMSVGSTFT